MSLFPSSEQNEAQEARMRLLQREQAQLEQQMRIQQYAAQYEAQFAFPAVVESALAGKRLRTDDELIQLRLIEAGLLFEVPTPLSQTIGSLSDFVKDLESSDCFHAVHVNLGGQAADSSGDQDNEDTVHKLTVKLDEKNWYKLYLGGGLKRDAFQQTGTPFGAGSTNDSSFLPTAEVEAIVGLRNVAGCLDTTDLQYSLDTHKIATWSLQHQRPLYSVVPPGLTLRDWLLVLPSGSQYTFTSKLVWDTIDWELTRGFHEAQRQVSVMASTSRPSQTVPPPFGASIEWSLLFRDIIPRRCATSPFHFAASPDVLEHSGPSVKHAIRARVEGNVLLDEYDEESPYFPTNGYQYRIQTEAAIPPGDAGFIKGQLDCALHLPVPGLGQLSPDESSAPPVSVHTLLSVGMMKHLRFDGLCRPTASFSDRFLLGGPSNFRGFSPAGVGPRSSNKTGSGYALGGDFFYKTTAMISTAVPAPGFRIFAFGNAGTCASLEGGSKTPSVYDVLSSSRVSAGVGLAATLMGPRLEITYTWPLRYGPADHRRSFQLGMGFSMFD